MKKHGNSFAPLNTPARLSAEQAAELLGFSTHDIPFLVAKKLLRPLGNPSRNSPKFFAACELLEMAADRAFLDKATRAVSDAWRSKNSKGVVSQASTNRGEVETE